MKKWFMMFGVALLFATQGIAQNTPKKEDDKTVKPTDPKKLKPKPKKQDYIILNFNWNGWLGSPAGMSVSPFSRGFEFYLMQDIPLGRSPMSFAVGLGISSENIFTNAFLRDSADGDNVYFQQITPVINSDNPTAPREWKKYKLNTTIVELPIEFRFRLKPNKRNTFKMAAGFKIGYVVDSKDKYVGPDYRIGEDLNDELRQKNFPLPGINRFRYGIYTRIGYGRFHLTASYTFMNFFESGKGLDGVTPVSIGLSITPF